MKFLFLILSTLISCAGICADAFDFKVYSKCVNHAELAITAGNYSQAMLYYDSAFAIKEKPFSQDLYNAGICAINNAQLDKAMKYCQSLASKGVGAAFFKDKFVYKQLTQQKGWKELLITAEQSRQALQAQNGGLLHLLDSLVEKDQRVNHAWRESGMAGAERTVMDQTYDTLSKHLNQLFDTLGFISEDRIGATLEKNSNALSYSLPHDIIIIHNYQARKTGDTLFRPILYKAMRAGMIKPEYLAFIEDFGSNLIGRPSYGTAHFYIRYLCSIYLDKYNKERLSEINTARASIGMGNTEDDLKKIIFKINNPGTDFMIWAHLSQYESFANEASKENFLLENEVIVPQIPYCKGYQ